MADFTDILVEEYIAKHPTATEKADALKAYNDGIKAGYVDLGAFHLAYDDLFEQENLLDCFKNDGALAHRGIYGRVSNADTEAKKLIKKLWVYTYSTQPSKYPPYKPQALPTKQEFEKQKAHEAAIEAEKAKQEAELQKIEALKSLIKVIKQTISDKLNKDLAGKIKQIEDLYKIINPNTTVFALEVNSYLSGNGWRLEIWAEDGSDPSFSGANHRSKVAEFVIDENTATTFLDTLDYDTLKSQVEITMDNAIVKLKAKAEKQEFIDNAFKANDLAKKHGFDFYFRCVNGKIIKINWEKRLITELISKNEIDDLSLFKDPKLVAAVSGHSDNGNCYVYRKTAFSFNDSALMPREQREIGIPSDADISSSNNSNMFDTACKIFTDFNDVSKDDDFINAPGFDTWIKDIYECDSSD